MDIDSEYSTDKFKELLESIEEIIEQQLNPFTIEKSVEHIRHLSEFLIYGASKENTYFEIFAERNILGTFSEILDRGCDEI